MEIRFLFAELSEERHGVVRFIPLTPGEMLLVSRQTESEGRAKKRSARVDEQFGASEAPFPAINICLICSECSSEKSRAYQEDLQRVTWVRLVLNSYPDRLLPS